MNTLSGYGFTDRIHGLFSLGSSGHPSCAGSWGVMQSSGLLPHRTVLDNITTVPRLNGVPKSRARKRAAELLDVVGLAPALGKR